MLGAQLLSASLCFQIFAYFVRNVRQRISGHLAGSRVRVADERHNKQQAKMSATRRKSSLDLVSIVTLGTRGFQRLVDNNKPRIISFAFLYNLIFKFLDVTIIILDTQSSEVRKAVDKLNQKLKLNINFQTIRKSEDLGTASALKKVAIPGEVI